LPLAPHNQSDILGPPAPGRGSQRIAVPTFTLDRPAQLEGALWGVTLLGWLVYALYFAHLTSFPFQDYPNHFTRATVMADLLFHGGQRFGSSFELHFALAPYLLHDAILTCLVALFGTVGGATVFMTLVLVSLPCALLYYMHVNDLPSRARLFALIISLYLATDWFFVMGFTAFRLALAIILVSLAITDKLRRHWSRSTFAAYILVLTLGYLTHLTSLVFFAPVLAVTGAARLRFRSTSLRCEVLLWLPVAALLLIHFGLLAAVPHDAAHPPAYSYFWGTFHDKVRRLNWEFERFDGRPSPLMMYTLCACVAWAVHRHLHWRAFVKPEVIEHVAVAATFLVIYLVLPNAYEDSTFVDVRALCMVALFLLLAALYLPSRAAAASAFGAPAVVGLALLVACVNFAYLVLHMGRNDTWLSRYRQVVAAIPAGAKVLPVYTEASQSDIAPFLHAASYVTLERGALIPYLFSGDRGEPMKYFTYKHHPYTPDEFWYKDLEYWNSIPEATYEVGGRRYTWRFYYFRPGHQWKTADLAPVDWNRVACEYDYLLVTVPFREPYLEVPIKPVAYNETAALLAVDKHACHPHPGTRHAQAVRLPLERW
jgi:hypothetical protein